MHAKRLFFCFLFPYTKSLQEKSHPIIGYSTVYLKWIWVIYKKSSLKLLKNISTYLPLLAPIRGLSFFSLLLFCIQSKTPKE